MNPIDEKLFHCRLAAGAWANFTGSMGYGAMFKDGLSVEPLTKRQIARIGSTTQLVHADTGEQVGPSALHNFIQARQMEVQPQLVTKTESDAKEEESRKDLFEAEQARKAAEAKALEEAKAKAIAAVEDGVVYTRDELEAIGANDGIAGLREIATPLGVKGRGIAELVNEILEAQNKLTAN